MDFTITCLDSHMRRHLNLEVSTITRALWCTEYSVRTNYSNQWVGPLEDPWRTLAV